MNPPPIRVLLVDDHPVVRSGLRAMLGASPVIMIIGEAGTATEALRQVRESAPDVVLCDLRLGDGPDGVAVTSAIRAEPDPPAVIILTTYDHDRDILRAVEAGAAGYLLKDATAADIAAAVQAAVTGRLTLDDHQTARYTAALREATPALSDREAAVLRLLGAGLTNTELADRLFVAPATVKTHLVHIFAKLGVPNRTSAVARARDLGLLD